MAPSVSTRACILWRRIDWSGHEAARLVQREAGWELSGTAVFAYETRACRLDYVIACDVGWRTVATQVTGWVGAAAIDIAITVDTQGRWWLNERECAAVAGCVDVDLNFSPSTNPLPIRRLRLEVGHSVPVRAAWLRFPSFALEPFEQTYRRLGPTAYRYESAGGFAADLDVDANGFPTRYGDIWHAEAFGGA
ncbi:MAG: hypothetical protein FJZ38_05625 [Candidatus Rokubacteria bacterium]|nr:hypothetical protein [Candidatus Rokubacteria bacterium]